MNAQRCPVTGDSSSGGSTMTPWRGGGGRGDPQAGRERRDESVRLQHPLLPPGLQEKGKQLPGPRGPRTARRRRPCPEATRDKVRVSEQVRLTGQGRPLRKGSPAAGFLGPDGPHVAADIPQLFRESEHRKEHPDDPHETVHTSPRSPQGQGPAVGRGGGSAASPGERSRDCQIHLHLRPLGHCDCSGKRRPDRGLPMITTSHVRR